ncbi:peptide deformylase [Candidatus Peregrinibacteria bacterium]|nr:peptide deformylase [Candidatus Peregrinibacteria bacterium]
MGSYLFGYTPLIAVLPILTGKDNPILRKKTQEIPRVTKNILTLLNDMEKAMEKAQGVGLAAPQVGLALRVCIAILHGKVTAFINPNITWKSHERETAEEGCLSLPDTWVPVPRACAITVRFRNRKGKEEERKLEGLPARILQHEMDHLDGILIVDYQQQTHA